MSYNEESSCTDSQLGPYSHMWPTTLRTVTTSDADTSSHEKESDYPFPTSQEQSNVDELPDNPNYPWGGDSPVHRHQPVTHPGEANNGAVPKHGMKRSRWDRAVSKAKAKWHESRQEEDEAQKLSEDV